MSGCEFPYPAMEFITRFDQHILETLYALRDPFLVQVLIWMSELASVWTIVGLTAVAVLLFVLKQHYAYAAGIAISVAISGVGVLLGKGLLQRARPDEVYQAYVEVWYSFPSAHAALGAALYGFLLYVVWRSFPSRVTRYALLLAGIAVIGVVSFSRLYLGVHFFSDVAAGLVLGFASAWIGATFVAYMRRS